MRGEAPWREDTCGERTLWLSPQGAWLVTHLKQLVRSVGAEQPVVQGGVEEHVTGLEGQLQDFFLL
jgi:hypothetical protein